jgi:hypothetical protein
MVRINCAVLASLLVAAPAAHAQQREATDATPIVRISARGGTVRVTGGPAAEVVLHEPARAAGARLSRGEAGVVNVMVAGDAPVDVRVPAGARVTVSARGGVHVEGVTGTVRVRGGTGRVRVAGRPDEIEVETLSGPIELETAAASIRVSTISGAIDIAGRLPEFVSLSTTSGTVRAAMAGVRSGRFESTSGDVLLTGPVEPGASIRATSVSGMVQLEVPAGTGLELDLEAVAGAVQSEFGPEPVRSRWTGGESLQYTIGGGGARFSARTVSGLIRVLRS